MNAMGKEVSQPGEPGFRRSIYKCENIEDVLRSEHFYKLLKGITTSYDVERILRKLGENGGEKTSTDDKNTLKSFLENKNTWEKGKNTLFVNGVNIPTNTATTKFVVKLLGNNGINLLISSIADLAGIILFSDRERKLKELNFPEMPESWNGDSELESRYNILMNLALENEEWWRNIGCFLVLNNNSVGIGYVTYPVKCIKHRIPGNSDFEGKKVDEYFGDLSDHLLIYNYFTESKSFGVNQELLMKGLGIENWSYWIKDDKNNNMYAKAFDYRTGKPTSLLPRKHQECFVLNEVKK